MTPTDKTVELVPLAELTALARLGRAMRKAQRAYFEARKRTPHCPVTTEWRAVIAAERSFDAAAEAALTRERVSLPGMEGGVG